MCPELQPLLKKALEMRRGKIVSQVASHCSHLSVKIVSNGRTMWKRIYNENDLLALSDL